MGPELTVQIVNYRTATYLGPCLRSLLPALERAGVTSRVTVLDNASGDDLATLQGEFAGSVEFILGGENVGFGAGQNLLAARGDSPLLCFVNPDVVADDGDVFSCLLDTLTDPRVAVAGPLLLTPGGDPQRFDHGELRGVRARVANGAGHAYWRARTERTESAWVSGAFLLVRRTAFDAVGGFDPGFFLYKEEEDLCLRIRRRGNTVLYAPDARATHIGAVVAGRDPDMLAASVARYRAKHHNGPVARLCAVLHRTVTRRF